MEPLNKLKVSQVVERLPELYQELRERNALTVNDMARQLDVTPHGYRFFESGRFAPKLSRLITLVRYLEDQWDDPDLVWDPSPSDVLTGLVGQAAEQRAAAGLTRISLAEKIGVASSCYGKFEADIGDPFQTTVLAVLRWVESR